MRKKTMISALGACLTTALVLSIIPSCQKSVSPDLKKNTYDVQVNQWLDRQIASVSGITRSSLQSLKDNLDLSKTTIEQYNQQKRFMIVPVKEAFKSLHQMTPSSVNNLLLIMDNTDAIISGQFIKFEPEGGEIKNLPRNTLSKIYNGKRPDVNGTFKFLSLSGHLKFELGFKSDKSSFVGILKPKNDQMNGTARMEQCIDWYLVTDFYDQFGNLIAETSVYITNTCDDCSNGVYESICQGDGQGGGGQVGDENCQDEQAAFAASSVSELEGSSIVSSNSSTITKTYDWTFFKQSFNFWHYTSHETGVQVYNANVTHDHWQFQSLTHNSESRTGIVIGGNVSMTLLSATPTVGLYNAYMVLHYNVQMDAVCKGSPISFSSDYEASHYFSVND